MGRKQHQADKLWLTTQEWKYFFGGKKPGRKADPDEVDFKRLPFDHCALSLQRFENPYSDEDGNVFDLVHIIPYLKKFKANPVTGKPLDSKGLIKLNYQKNAAGEYHCPVMYKVFNPSTHIACIKTTGNVFCYEAVEELNIKTKNFKDLINDEPFVKSDIIILQDPRNMTKFNLSSFHHVKHSLKVDDDELERAKTDPRARMKKVNHETRDTLNELERTYKAPETVVSEKVKADIFNSAHYSTGLRGASLTSTAYDRVTETEAAILDEDIVKYRLVNKKGYVRINTNLGPLNLELYCDTVPKTCENFLKLCAKGYYNNTIFHRSIRHFMLQGGDPTGTGSGGDSHFGGTFKDEIKPQYHHTGRGVLSMANSGPDSNKSQFFITYRSCKHLDGKHTIFGKLVGGMDTLTTIEAIGTDNKDKPVEDIKIERVAVFVDPFQEAEDQLKEMREKEIEKLNLEKNPVNKDKTEERKVFGSGVGKYINPSVKKEARKAEEQAPPVFKKPKTTGGFGDFSAW
ncbi:peptidyl-prolyl cis-trans isomerase-like 2 [Eurytemora carolleeae]|uniref:peptidyl-prolyl cis-trans isomerase-like 2 n=1 Tax=Eurytemora carolleeae TaxID=1294199 RepID=UPI000C785B75|nr:peptidyl-prolyl cis-trans isomerase-like 2 [Eurytemora carolleeae]|eukprot:XP_023321470.1 peptidyl-prolyl cis-trans isomerase-like 2 [Eurytemora affinis]